MRQSTIPTQYYIQPPNIPDFIYKSKKMAWYYLMEWSYKEYQARLNQNARRGYILEHLETTREYSPIRILAEMRGFRRLCANMPQSLWDTFTARERQYIRHCYEMRDYLLRETA